MINNIDQLIAGYKYLLNLLLNHDYISNVVEHLENLNPSQLSFACYWFEDKFLEKIDSTCACDIMGVLDRFFSEAQYHTKEMFDFARECLLEPLKERLECLEEQRLYV